MSTRSNKVTDKRRVGYGEHTRYSRACDVRPEDHALCNYTQAFTLHLYLRYLDSRYRNTDAPAMFIHRPWVPPRSTLTEPPSYRRDSSPESLLLTLSISVGALLLLPSGAAVRPELLFDRLA